MNPAERFRHFKFPGPVTAQFAADRTNPVRALLGPQGGGKSVTIIFDALRNASLMPVCVDGVIRFKLAIIRDTYGRLQETTIPTWLQWLPKDDGEWDGGGGRQAHHRLAFETVRGGEVVPVQFEAVFAAIGDQAIEDFMRGFEVTAFWFNEMDLLAEEVLTLGIGRIGRFPSRDLLPPGASYRDYIVGDLNAPDIDSWFYRRFEEDKPQGHALYRQPGGRDPKAENIQNLKPGYYSQQIALNASKPRWIRRFVDAKYGPSEDGEPVYPEYSDDRHLAPEPLKPAKGVPLKLGLDAGIQRPACVIGQWLPTGQRRILGEVVPGRCGATRFAEQVRQWLAENAPDHEVEIAFSDPAGFTGADKENNELAWAETVMEVLGLQVEPAPSNELGLRLDAVRDELTHMIDGDTPSLLISPACKVLRKGFAGSYKYRREQVGNTWRTSDRPIKDEFSHVQDALQYLCLGDKGRYGVVSAKAGRTPEHVRKAGEMQVRQLKTEFDVMGV